MNVLLIHGLGRTPLSMGGVGQVLRRRGHFPHFFGYAAWQHSYGDIVIRLRQEMVQIADTGPYAIVAHSLGGVLSRSALQDWSGPRPEHIIMLGTPNQSPRLAAIAQPIPLFQWFAAECGANLASAEFYRHLAPPPVPYTIIAGTAGPQLWLSPFGAEPNDGIVALSETKIHAGDRPVQIQTLHTFMMNHGSVQSFILSRLGEA
ncbi:esterase/lipase family protein [Lyngbya confervoides]|uniref:Alpha/beta hydrolase n=1 Tax=Lyngbya confervoides BDU141951 TaxID=1574623 RepID=A0ABD4T5Q0_9CYAN|nr:alpha/beta hydrolase [Lyngbya confervoides]MCM1983813.1 hypothetical protein [Lyngbya confervoides BDU141951]